jgi:hypothetical protein
MEVLVHCKPSQRIFPCPPRSKFFCFWFYVEHMTCFDWWRQILNHPKQKFEEFLQTVVKSCDSWTLSILCEKNVHTIDRKWQIAWNRVADSPSVVPYNSIHCFSQEGSPKIKPWNMKSKALPIKLTIRVMRVSSSWFDYEIMIIPKVLLYDPLLRLLRTWKGLACLKQRKAYLTN